MTITASMVKELRESTGAGMMDAKKALTETDGNMEAAIDWLRAKGLAAAAKKSGRTAAEGLVGVAVEGTRGSVVEVNSELADAPQRLNEDPYGEGWICVIEPSDPGAVEALLDAAAYSALLE